MFDFGSATLASYLTLCFTRTSRQLPFSLRYAAPEILDGSSETHTTMGDVYALGMTILQIMTGEPPYAGKSDRVVITNVFRSLPPSRLTFDDVIDDEGVKDKLWNLFLRCWENDPSLRPTAAEVKRTNISGQLIEIQWGPDVEEGLSDNLGLDASQL
ncbi:hypothetical protein FRC11_005689 [Ceratobasidium sp. 423]|nr:hypothetical protein FRC11_005689 [Ceratobasidium sp. 423]